MYRKLLLLGACALWLGFVGGDSLLAQGFPEYDSGDSTNEHYIQRGLGIYLGIVKMVSCLILFLFWVKSSDWVGEDCRTVGEHVGLSPDVWNPLIVFSFLAAFLFCAISIPLFAIGYSILVLAYIGPLGTYVFIRNSRVGEDDKVLTAAHFQRLMAGGKKKEVVPLHEQGAPLEIEAVSGDEQQRQANMIAVRQDESFLLLKELLYDVLRRQARRVLMDYTKDAISVRIYVDGVWHNLEPREREPGDAMLAVAKQICNMNPADRRSRQEGEFLVKITGKKIKYNCTLTSQGVKTGERVIIELVNAAKPFKTMEDLGMREKMRQQLDDILKQKTGFFLISGTDESGLSTTWEIALTNTDRLMRDYVAIEDKDKRLTKVQNIEVSTFNGAAGETPDVILPKLMLKQPEALVLSNLVNGETVKFLCDQILTDDKLVIAKIKAKDTAEALLRVLLLKAPVDRFATCVTGVLNQRLVRKLCNDCKQAYEPPPQLLQKLGIPAGRIAQLYREYQPPPPDEEPKRKKGEPEVCPTCSGIGYRGRTAIYELLVVNDEVRNALKTQPKMDAVRAAARSGGLRTLQAEGILLVATGVTSLQELQRILSQ